MANDTTGQLQFFNNFLFKMLKKKLHKFLSSPFNLLDALKHTWGLAETKPHSTIAPEQLGESALTEYVPYNHRISGCRVFCWYNICVRRHNYQVLLWNSKHLIRQDTQIQARCYKTDSMFPAKQQLSHCEPVWMTDVSSCLVNEDNWNADFKILPHASQMY